MSKINPGRASRAPSAPVTLNARLARAAPMGLAVKAGTTVAWKRLDREPHTVVNDGLFHSTVLDQNGSSQFRFRSSVCKVSCGIHSSMKKPSGFSRGSVVI